MQLSTGTHILMSSASSAPVLLQSPLPFDVKLRAFTLFIEEVDFGWQVFIVPTTRECLSLR